MMRVWGKGKVEGVAYVTEIYKGERVRAEILLAKYVDPDALPALSKFKAVLLTYGGILSHAAIFCREMEIPCLVSVPEEFRKRKPKRILVDLDTPAVIVLE